MAEQINESYKLTEQDKNDILDAMKEEVQKSENLRVLSELPSNNGQEEHVPEHGYEKEITYSMDPKTGEKVIISSEEVKEKMSLDDKLSEIGKSIDEFDESNYEIGMDDVKNVISEDSLLGKYEISNDSILDLINLMNKYKETKKITYKELPNEVQKYVDQFVRSQGILDNSKQSNTVRNTVSNMLMEEYIHQIELNKFSDDFQSKIENFYKDTKEEFSPLLKEYNENREAHLAKLTEGITDESKKKLAGDVLDSINDAYQLSRLKDSAKFIKIKPFDLEKPKRSFDSFLNKYRDTQYHIYDIYMCTNILHKHLVMNNIITDEQNKYAIKIMVAFAKFCEKYKIENADEHAFMYFFTHNIVLLDVYVGEQYNEYAPTFLANIKEFYELLK